MTPSSTSTSFEPSTRSLKTKPNPRPPSNLKIKPSFQIKTNTSKECTTSATPTDVTKSMTGSVCSHVTMELYRILWCYYFNQVRTSNDGCNQHQRYLSEKTQTNEENGGFWLFFPRDIFKTKFRFLPCWVWKFRFFIHCSDWGTFK